MWDYPLHTSAENLPLNGINDWIPMEKTKKDFSDGFFIRSSIPGGR
jgi:hypothetical protein